MISDTITAPTRCVNLDYLTLRTKSNPELLLEMIAIYIQQTPILLGVCKQSILTKNWGMLQAAIHKLIPSFWMMGIDPHHGKLGEQIQEYVGIQNKTWLIAGLFAQLETVCLQVCDELIEISNTIKEKQI